MSERVDLRSMTLNELKDFAISIGVPAFRGAQIFDWIYKGKKSFREMNNLPEALRYELEDKASSKNLIYELSKNQSLTAHANICLSFQMETP